MTNVVPLPGILDLEGDFAELAREGRIQRRAPNEEQAKLWRETMRGRARAISQRIQTNRFVDRRGRIHIFAELPEFVPTEEQVRQRKAEVQQKINEAFPGT